MFVNNNVVVAQRWLQSAAKAVQQLDSLESAQACNGGIIINETYLTTSSYINILTNRKQP